MKQPYSVAEYVWIDRIDSHADSRTCFFNIIYSYYYKLLLMQQALSEDRSHSICIPNSSKHLKEAKHRDFVHIANFSMDTITCRINSGFLRRFTTKGTTTRTIYFQQSTPLLGLICRCMRKHFCYFVADGRKKRCLVLLMVGKSRVVIVNLSHRCFPQGTLLKRFLSYDSIICGGLYSAGVCQL